jgi:hypothetical protein
VAKETKIGDLASEKTRTPKSSKKNAPVLKKHGKQQKFYYGTVVPVAETENI